MNNSAQKPHKNLDQVWANLPGWGRLAAVNHTTVGIRFMITGMCFFLVGGLLAMLMRTQLAQPNQDIVTAEFYSQAFTMHGTVMMFLFAIPVLEGLSMYLIPKMIGARDLVFPRLSAFGYFCYLFGGLIILSSLFFGAAPDTGWFMYTPLSGATYSPDRGADFWLLGITFVEISAISAGVELFVSIMRSRTDGMNLRQMPIFCWYILAMSLMIIFGFPPLILASILLELERAAGMIFFDVDGGGDPLLWQHLFWLFGHPEVYLLFLPAAGIVSTLIPVFANRPILGYRWIVLSIILTGFISFGLWVHHMFTVGIPQLAQAFFSVASMMIAVPTGIQLFAWLGTLWTGRVRYSLPMLWIFGFLVIFVAGGLTGVMLALVPFNWQVHDTHFVVAHMHYVLVGGMFFPLMAGLYYWLPHFSGRVSSEKLGRLGFWLTFGGFNLTFLLMHVTGLLGMPRRSYTYEADIGWSHLNLLSSIGGFVMALGIAVILLDFILHFRFGKSAKPNPWHADTLEWATPIPPNNYNFTSLPTLKSRHPLWDQADLPENMAAGKHHLASAEHGRRETIGSNPVTGRIQEIIHLPTNSWLPFQAGLALAALCLSLLFKTYILALFATALSVFLLLRWSWQNGAHPVAAPVTKDEPTHPPLHSRTVSGPGLWGMGTALLANGTLYLSLLFGWLYLWTVAPLWAAPSDSPIDFIALLGSGIILSLATWLYTRTVRNLKQGKADGLGSRFSMIAGLGLLHFILLVWVFIGADLQPTQTAHDSVLSVMFYYLLIHSGFSVILTVMQACRVRFGYVGAGLPYEPVVLRLFWLYTLGIFWTAVAAFVLLLPMAWEVV
ncbi:MAG: cytochrome c oxidase subunit I [Pseudomonadota bacterium]